MQCLASSEILTAWRVCSPPPLVRGEDTLAGWRGGGRSIVRKTPDTDLYSMYVNTLLSGAPVAVCAPSPRGHGDESGYCGETHRHTVPQDLHSET